MLGRMRLLCQSALVILALALGSCTTEDYDQEATIVGWTCMPSYGGCDSYGMNQTVAHATVGWPFEWVLLASCNTGDWNLEWNELATGKLPPGLEFAEEGDHIVGVPTRAGSFSFTVTHHGISCPNASYMPYGDLTGYYTIEVRGN